MPLGQDMVTDNAFALVKSVDLLTVTFSSNVTDTSLSRGVSFKKGILDCVFVPLRVSYSTSVKFLIGVLSMRISEMSSTSPLPPEINRLRYCWLFSVDKWETKS